MLRSRLTFAVVALIAGAVSSLPARADMGCCCLAPCVAAAPPVMVYEPYQMPQIYIVDRGPVYSGPGIYANPTVVLPGPLPHYPYVGRDYPYGGHGHPGYLPPYAAPLRARAQAVTPRRGQRPTYR